MSDRQREGLRPFLFRVLHDPRFINCGSSGIQAAFDQADGKISRPFVAPGVKSQEGFRKGSVFPDLLHPADLLPKCFRTVQGKDLPDHEQIELHQSVS